MIPLKTSGFNNDRSYPAGLAPYACRPQESRGRLYEEPESPTRTCYQRDRDRIVHCSAFRRLKYKTQVFVYHEGDHYRTRLTHTLEVSQIARTLARALNANEDLTEAISLAHDLGHTPFAHIGEEHLKECMKKYGGFEHNDQSLRVLTVLEHKYPRWKGLNLTRETLEGIIKHSGPVMLRKKDFPFMLALFQKENNFDLKTQPSLEAQIAGLSDDIAYNNHDVEDGLRARLFTLEELEKLSFLSDLIARARRTYPDLPNTLLVQEVIREMIGTMVTDVLTETRKNLETLNPSSPQDIYSHGDPLVRFSDSLNTAVKELRAFLFERMYHYYTIRRLRLKVKTIVTDMFEAFIDDYRLLPDNWQQKVKDSAGVDNTTNRARIVADYIAGMTDRYALREHARMFELHRWDIE